MFDQSGAQPAAGTKILRPFLVACLVSSLAIAGCAKKTQDISAIHVPASQYDHMLCSQLRSEGARVARQAALVFGDQDLKSSAGAVIYWPKAMIGRGNASEEEVARLKGEMAAIEQSSNAKNCGIQFATNDGAPRYDAGGVKVDARGNVGNSLYNLPPKVGTR
ncbi:MAG: hypothetical protein U1E28_06010 [Beijerinckiaceae bacterium]|mgnify:CR=1 FL=1